MEVVRKPTPEKKFVCIVAHYISCDVFDSNHFFMVGMIHIIGKELSVEKTEIQMHEKELSLLSCLKNKTKHDHLTE